MRLKRSPKKLAIRNKFFSHNCVLNPASHSSSKLSYLFLALVLHGCISVPDAPKIINQSQQTTSSIEIESRHKILSPKQADKIIQKIEQSAGAEDLLQKHLLVEQSVAETPLIAGNDVHLLFDGEQTFNAIYQAISAAKTHVNLEYFIFEDIQFETTDLKTLLLDKVAQGVQVSVIYDAFGSSATPADFFEVLKKGGVHLTEYHPINLENISNVNQRDHRKILVIDGKVAIVGGVNLSATYQSKSHSGSLSKSSPDVSNAYWRDTDMRIEGPAVAELQRLFLAHWDVTQAIDQSSFFPTIEKHGNELVRVIGSAPNKEMPRFYVTLISAIQNADKEITLSSAYFVPTSEEKKQLSKAAKRGVKINLLVPGVSDSSIAMYVQRSHYEDLLEDGINIYESEDEILHAKTITIDGVWSVVGSSNFDYRSAASNQEVDVVVLGSETSNELTQKFDQDLVEANKIELAKWEKRPLLQKFKEHFYRVFQKLL